MVDHRFTCVRLDELMVWLEKKLLQKYSLALEGVNKRFIPIFCHLEGILVSAVEIHSMLQHCPDTSIGRINADNMIHILNEIILEFPTLIDYSYCDYFISTFQDRFDQLNASFHPLIHINLQNSRLNSKFISNTSNIGALLAKLPNFVLDLQSRYELSSPLLKCIDLSLSQFKEPASLLLQDIRHLSEISKVKEEYESVKFQIKRMPTGFEASSGLKRISELVQVFNECQIELESTLEHIFQMCLLVKNKGKKIIKEDSKEDIRDLLSYVNLMLKPDFYSLLYEIFNKDDLVSAIMHLQSQKSLFYELKKQEPYRSGLESINVVKEEDLRSLIFKWQDAYSEIEKFKKTAEFSQAFQDFNSNLTLPLEDLKIYSERLRDLQRAVLQYHSANNRFKRFKYKLFKYCIEEFTERVELIWPTVV